MDYFWFQEWKKVQSQQNHLLYNFPNFENKFLCFLDDYI